MLDIKTISKIKKMHFDQFYSVKYISRKLELSKNTVYKYLKMSDFNTDVKLKKSNNLAAAEYKDIIVGWLEEDRRHHTKQRHTSTRIHARLKDTCEGFKLSYNSINKYVITLKNEVYQLHNGFLPLTHPAGEAQVDFGECSYTYKNNKLLGYFCVMTFPYSNASYCQLMKAKNSECVFLALRNIF